MLQRTPPAKISASGPLRTSPSGVLPLGLATAAAMWAVGYVSRLPLVLAPSPLVLLLMLVTLFAGAAAAGRYLPHGWRSGVKVSLVAATVNLLILGSLLTNDDPNRIVPSALWWVPGSYLLSVLLGAAGGAVGASRPVPVRPPEWTLGYSAIAASTTFLLLVAGGLVTSKDAGLAVVDWPNSFGHNMFLFPLSRMTGGVYYEHAHRLFGTLVGLCTIALVLHLYRHEPRRWLFRLGLVVLVSVVVQGTLGGLRVTGRLTLSMSPEDMAPSTVLAAVHGILGQLFFALLIVMVVFTMPSWRDGRPATRTAALATDRGLALALLIGLLVQLVLGAVQRHLMEIILTHITIAAVIIALGIAVGVRAWGLYDRHRPLRHCGVLLVTLLLLQTALGIGALVVTRGMQQSTDHTVAEVLVATAHQAVGALLLGCTAGLLAWLWREPAILPEESQGPGPGAI